jgi:hypothetical protein
MKPNLVEAPTCTACTTGITALGLHDRQCDSCGMRFVAESGETQRTHEQTRLLLSRDAVLRHAGPSEPGSSPW